MATNKLNQPPVDKEFEKFLNLYSKKGARAAMTATLPKQSAETKTDTSPNLPQSKTFNQIGNELLSDQKQTTYDFTKTPQQNMQNLDVSTYLTPDLSLKIPTQNKEGTKITKIYTDPDVQNNIDAKTQIYQNTNPILAGAIKGAYAPAEALRGIQNTVGKLLGAKDNIVLEDPNLTRFKQERQKVMENQGFLESLPEKATETIVSMLPAIASGGALGLVQTGVMAGGKNSQSALDEGATGLQAAIFGAGTGISEALTERLGFIPGIDSAIVKGLTGSIKKNVGKIAFDYGKKALQEGLEEVIMEPTTGLLQKVTYQPNKAWFGQNAVVDPQAMAEAGALGTIIGGVMGGAQVPSYIGQSSNAASSMRGINSVIDTALKMPVQSNAFKLAQEMSQKSNLTYDDYSKLVNEVRSDLNVGLKMAEASNLSDRPATVENTTQQSNAINVRPTTLNGKLQIKNVAYENAKNNYDAAVLFLQDKYQTNDFQGVVSDILNNYAPVEQRTVQVTPEIALDYIKQNDGIDLIGLANNIQSTENAYKNELKKDIARLKRASGMASQRQYNILDGITKNTPKTALNQSKNTNSQIILPQQENTGTSQTAMRNYAENLRKNFGQQKYNNALQLFQNAGTINVNELAKISNISVDKAKTLANGVSRILGIENGGNINVQNNQDIMRDIQGGRNGDSLQTEITNTNTQNDADRETKTLLERGVLAYNSKADTQNLKIVTDQSLFLRSLREFYNAFGLGVTFYEGGNNGPLGFYIPDAPSRLFVNVDASENIIAHTTAHESYHALKRNDPELFGQLVDYIYENLDQKQIQSFMESYEDYEGLKREFEKDPKIIAEEIAANEFANNITDKAWWEELYSKNQNLFKKLMYYVKQWLDKITSGDIKQNNYLTQKQVEAFAKKQMEIMQQAIKPSLIESKPESQERLEDRSFEDVGNRKVKSYMELNPVMAEYIQTEAERMLSDLNNTIRGEKVFKKDEQGYMIEVDGIKKHTTPALQRIWDAYNGNITYAKIEKGLRDIINGKPSNALSKRIELIIDDNLSEGTLDLTGETIPPNEEYLELKALVEGREYEAPKDARRPATKLVNGVEMYDYDDITFSGRRTKYSGKRIKQWAEGFPKVVPQTSLPFLKSPKNGNLELHTKAKSGDLMSAIELVNRSIKKEKIIDLGNRNSGAILVYPHAEESTGKNAIPGAYANAISSVTGLDVDSDIVQTNKAERTNKNRTQRLLQKVTFSGNVKEGANYVIVDDVVTQGGTVNSLRKYIIENGGNVTEVTALALARGMDGTLAIKPSTLQKLKELYGYDELNKLLQESGIADSAEELTEAEATFIAESTTAQYIINSGSRNTEGRQAKNKSQSTRILQEQSDIKRREGVLFSSKRKNLQTESEAFKEWFGNSKVVDENDEPLVVYHGTSRAGFNIFDPYVGRYGLFGDGFYFTENPSIASEYTEKGKGNFKAIYPAYLSINNPLDINESANLDSWKKAFSDAEPFFENIKTNEDAYRAVEEYYKYEEYPSWEAREAIKDGLMTMGYDGITHIGGNYKSKGETIHRVWIAFEPTQIKSAIGNIGTFDANNPDIRYASKRKTRYQTNYDRFNIEKLIEGSENWKDKSLPFLIRETWDRNLIDIAGQNKGEELRKALIVPVKQAEGERNKFMTAQRNRIRALKLTRQESELVQRYGEGVITAEELKGLQPQNWKKIEDAAKVFRSIYNELIENANNILIQNGYPPVPKRKDYFPHFDGTDSIANQLGFKLDVFELPTDINGLTADFKPGKNFFSNFLRRKGNNTTYDAVQGFDTYIEGISKVIYHTDNIQRLRTFNTALRRRFSNDYIEQKIEEIERSNLPNDLKQEQIQSILETTGLTHLSNVVVDLEEYINNLAGKKDLADRSAERTFGRKVYAIINWVKRRVGANMVALNPASWITNFIPLMTSAANTNKLAFAQAMIDTVANVVKNDGFVDTSSFLSSRRGSDPLYETFLQKGVNKLTAPFKWIDQFASEVVTRSKYYEQIRKGKNHEEAIMKADEWAGKIIGDRSLGGQPTLFNMRNPVTSLFTQFQLEVNNQVSNIFKDIPREHLKGDNKSLGRLIAVLAQLFLYNFLFNWAYEKFIGRKPAFDPISLVFDSIYDLKNEKLDRKKKGINILNRTTQQVPFVGTFIGGGRIPIESAIPDIKALVEGTTTIRKEIAKPLTYLLPPVGGGQIKKTLEGVDTVKKGGYYKNTPSGDSLQYSVQKTPANMVKAAVFGRSSLPETKKFYDEGGRGLTANQTIEQKAIGINPDEYLNGRDLQTKLNKAKTRQEKDDIKADIVDVFLKTGNATVFLPTLDKKIARTTKGDKEEIELSDEEYMEYIRDIMDYSSKIRVGNTNARTYDKVAKTLREYVLKQEKKLFRSKGYR